MMVEASRLLPFLWLLISPSHALGTPDKPESREQKSVAKWNLLQSAAKAPLSESYQREARYQSSSEVDMRCFAVADDILEQNSSSLVASMFLKVASDGGWIPDFDEDSWLSNPTQPGTEPEPRAFFALKFTNFTIQAKLSQTSELEILVPSGTHTPLTYFPVDKWMKLVLLLDSKGNIKVRVGGGTHTDSYPVFERNPNSSEALGEDEERESQVESPSKLASNGSDGGVASNKTTGIPSEICHIDVLSSKQPWLHIARVEVHLVPEFDTRMTCEAQLNGTQTLYKQTVADAENLNILCKDEFSLIVMPSHTSYFDHSQQCKKFQGSILSKEDVSVYEKELSRISSAAQSATGEYLSWIQSVEIATDNFNSWCQVLLRNVTFQMRPCYLSLESSICKVQTSLPFYLFGKIQKFVRKYTLISKPDGSWGIKGFSSLMTKKKKEWILLSNLHDETCVANDSLLPLVRSSWQCGDVANLTLAFSSCGPDSFSCNSGQCLSRESRCDDISQCDDESDEEMCDFIVKHAGYNIILPPPPLKEGEPVKVKYFFKAYSVAPVTTNNFYIEVDMAFGVHWMDPRLTIWNPKHRKNLECDDLWHPKFAAADGYPRGHRVPIPDQDSGGCMMALLPGVALQKSDDDPYMGRYQNGSSLELVHTLGGIFRIPCQFDLRKYPFGDQTCELNMWIDITNYRSIIYERFGKDRADEVRYYGRYDVREYRVWKAWRKEVNSNHSVSLVFEFKSLFGYHVLNSYFTSFLILLISFSTSAFRVEDFNERIMVSLTALLVLTALFTQANSTSVQTSYLKLLDMWYAALIGFSFLTVLVNTSLNSYRHKLDAAKKLGKQCLDEMTIVKKVKIMNNILFGSLATVFTIFILFYVLSAAGKI